MPVTIPWSPPLCTFPDCIRRKGCKSSRRKSHKKRTIQAGDFLACSPHSHYLSTFPQSLSVPAFSHTYGRHSDGLPTRRRRWRCRSLLCHLRRTYCPAIPGVPARGREDGIGSDTSHATMGRVVQHSVIDLPSSKNFIPLGPTYP